LRPQLAYAERLKTANKMTQRKQLKIVDPT